MLWGLLNNLVSISFPRSVTPIARNTRGNESMSTQPASNLLQYTATLFYWKIQDLELTPL